MGLGKDIFQIEFKGKGNCPRAEIESTDSWTDADVIRHTSTHVLVLILLMLTNTGLGIVEQVLLATEAELVQPETFKWPLVFCAIWSLSIAFFIILLKQLIREETREKCNHLLTCVSNFM